MSAIAIYPPDGKDPEIVYLQRNPHTATSVQDFSSINRLTSIVPEEPPPPIPRKSSRRGLRLSIVPETEPTTSFEQSAESAPSSSAGSPTSDDFHSTSSATTYSSSGQDALDKAIEDLETHQTGVARPPSYSSIDDAPSLPIRSPSRQTRESRTSSNASSRRYSDLPPEYAVEVPAGHPLEANAMTLSATEKEALRSVLKDEEADAEVEREESIYSLNIADPVPLPSAESKTLRIHAKGMHPIRLPLPSKELSILVTNTDDTLAYTSSRAKRSSPDFTLSTPEGIHVLRTTFNRQPTLTILQSDEPVSKPFIVTGKGLKRNQGFRLPNTGQEFEWKYIKTTNSRGRKEDRLMLVEKTPFFSTAPERNNSEASEDSTEISEKVAVATKLDEAKRLFPAEPPSKLKRRQTLKRSLSTSSGLSSGILAAAKATVSKKPTNRVLARLVRDDDAFTQHVKGSKGYRKAGEGGDLVLEPGCTELVPEEVVVATALIMMKKEQDRLRAVQAAVIVAAIL